MADKTYTQMWEEQKKKSPYLTLSNASTTKKTTKGSGANTVSMASANLGAGKATGGVSKPITIPKTTRTFAQYTPKPTPTPTIVVPTFRLPDAKTIGYNNALKGNTTDVEAYKTLMTRAAGANQRRTTNQGMYDDEERIEREARARGSGANAVSMASADLGANAIREYPDEKGVEEIVAPPVIAPVIEKSERELELENALAELEAELEREDPYESYMQALIDAQNAQSAAQLQMLRNQSGVLNQQYDNNAANLYAQYRRSGLTMPELMAGTATGLADSFALQNDLTLQNNLASNELERASAQNQLNAQANQIQADADLQAAQTAAEWAQMAYQRRQQELAAQREYQLALLDAQNSGGYDFSQVLKLLDAGLLSEGEARDYLGLGTSDAVVPNIIDTKAYIVRGLGRLSGAELKAGIASGQIDVYQDDSGHISYRKA